MAIPAVVVAGWWYLRNWQLYGDPTGLNAMLAIAGGRTAPGSFAALLAEFQGFLYSFWGVLGGFNVLLRPTWVYALLNLVILLALVGLAAWVWQTLATRHAGAVAGATVAGGMDRHRGRRVAALDLGRPWRRRAV